MVGVSRFARLASAAAVVAVIATQAIHAVCICPFCSPQERFAEKVLKAPVVLFGTLSNPRLSPDAAPSEPAGTTDMKVMKVLKSNPAVDNKKNLTLASYIPLNGDVNKDFIVFADVRDSQIVPYLGIPNDPAGLVDYIEKSVAIENAPTIERLSFFFKHLDDKNEDISRDAYSAFAMVPYSDVVKAKDHLDAEKLVAWLKDRQTQPFKIGLFGLMVGICGRSQDAELLRGIIENPDSRPITGIDGVMAGYCLLEPKRGSDLILKTLVDSKNDFNFRYAALRAVEFLLKEGKMDAKAAYAELAKTVSDASIADLTVDEMRKNKVWAHGAAILAVYDDPKFKDQQLVRRSIIKFALQCPSPKCKAFIEQQKKVDPQRIAIEEENLHWEEVQQQATSGVNGKPQT